MSEKPQLNVNLGLPISYDGALLKYVRGAIIPCSLLFEYTIERAVFGLWKAIPLRVRASIAKVSWSAWLSLHRSTIGKRTALHPSLSHEYAALTTVMWGARLLPMTLGRMRFGLNQIECNFPPNDAIRKEAVDAAVDATVDATVDEGDGKGNNKNKSSRVRGIYVHSQQDMGSAANRKVLFWLYGGAFLSGDCAGNVGLAESVACACNCDVFLAEYTLCPEGTIIDASNDVLNCYNWLIERSGKVTAGAQVSILGISSGGGLAVTLCQQMAKKPAKYQPKCCTLISPWVHYDWENLFGSLEDNAVHDLVVTQQVYNYVYVRSPEMAGGAQNRTTCSPLGRTMKGICPTLIVCSEHEATTDEDLALHAKMKKEGVEVTLHTYKYLCHVWCLVPLLPEATLAMGRVHDWMKQKIWS